MQKQKTILSLCVFIITVFVVSSCITSQKTPKIERNLADIYNPSKAGIHPNFSVYHINDSNTVVYLRIFPSELLFSQANESGKSLARFSINYVLFEYDENRLKTEFSDSARIEKTLDQENVRNIYFSALPLKAKSGSRYALQVYIKDELRSLVSKSYILIDKTSPFNRQNFQVLSAKSRYPTFSYDFSFEEEFLVKFNQFGFDSIHVDYYNLDRTLPRPIFSRAPDILMKTIPDSSWILPYTDSSTFKLAIPGIYMYKMKAYDKTGLTLYNFGKNFPRAKDSDDLLGPLIYLCSSAEFRDLRLKPNRKLAIDNYWLDIADNDMEASRELIRVYYNRVLYSNLYFSSYKEGWKTDRGMIYMIFGPPDLLEKNADEEIWSYRSKRSNSKLEFRFIRNSTALSFEDFILDRNSSSTAVWGEAVESWKRGRIYSAEL